MTREEQSSAEFKMLNDEIVENSKKTFQLIVACYTFSAAIIGYCFTPGHFPLHWGQPFAFLSSFLILIPGMVLIRSSQRSTVRIASYLQVAYDEIPPNAMLIRGWQSAIQAVRRSETSPTTSRLDDDGPLLSSYLKALQCSKTRSFSKSLALMFHLIGGISIASSIASAVYWAVHLGWLNRNNYGWSDFVECFFYVIALFLTGYFFTYQHLLLLESWEEDRFEQWLSFWRKEWLDQEDTLEYKGATETYLVSLRRKT